MRNTSKLHAGDWVEVRRKEEILRTLDAHGCFEGMPFMPEMLAYCGQRFQVFRRAHKACDTVFPIRSRRVTNAVHLDTRCSGQAHGGCQARCLLYWKDAWLKRVGPSEDSPASQGCPGPTADRAEGAGASRGCTEEALVLATCERSVGDAAEPVYVCQATRLPYASEELSPYDFASTSKTIRRATCRCGDGFAVSSILRTRT